MFEIDLSNCRGLGELIAKIPMRANAFLNVAPQLNNTRLNSLLFMYVSGICHQTETLEGVVEGQRKRGWDYLMAKFVELSRRDSNSLDPCNIQNISESDLSSILSDSGNPSDSTLSRSSERVRFLHDMTQKLIVAYTGNPLNIYGSGILGGNSGIYDKMRSFEAFGSDPIMKKSTLFFMLMSKSGLWTPFRDPQELKPMPDYHKERLFLRTGCIKVKDGEVDSKLLKREKQDIKIDNFLRVATADAYRQILRYSNKDFFELEVLLWSFARSFCYHTPVCISPVKDQGNFKDYAVIEEITNCPFATTCERKHAYWQPIVDTNFH